MSNYDLIIDTKNRRLVANYLSTEAGEAPTIIYGDKPTVSVRLVKPHDNNAEQPWQPDGDLSGQTIRVGVGSLADDTPSAYIELTDDLAAASAVVTEVRAGVLNTTNEIQRVEILDAVAGNYTLTIAGETTTPLDLDASLDCIKDAVEALASITVDSVSISGNPLAYNLEFDSSLADVGAITVNLDNVTSRVGKTGTLDLHVNEILTLLNGETSVDATLEVVRWTTADVAGETVLQVPVTVRQDVIPDTVPGTTPLPGYATIDLDHINQSGAVTGQIPQWNGSEWVPATVAGSGDLLSTANLSDVADAATSLSNLGGAPLVHTHTAADVTDFDTEVGNHPDVAANTSARHGAVTVSGTPDYITLSGQDIVRGQVDLTTDVTGSLPTANLNAGTGADATTFWRGDGTWSTPAGSGDMLAATYDPTAVVGDAFDMDNMVEGVTNKILTSAERTTLGNTSGTNTGDETAASIRTLGFFDTTNDGAGSGLDADLLDGNEASAFALASHTHTSSEITNNTSESTGVLTGGVLSTGAGAAEFSISDGTGQIVTAAGAVTAVSWSGLSNITPTNIATNLLTWVGINSGGSLVEKTSAFTPNEIRNTIFLGVIVHTDNTTVQTVNNQQVVAYHPLSTAYDIADAIGFVNKSGNVFSANGPTMSIAKSAGVLFKIGSNFDTDPTGNPHNKTLPALTPATFEYRYSDGSSQAPWLTTIDPNNLDDGAGGLTAVSNNRWHTQRIYSFVSNNCKIQRARQDYATKAAAIDAIGSDGFVTEDSIFQNGLLRGYLVLKQGATDLSDPAQAEFFAAPKFGEASSSAGAATPPGDASVVLIEALKATAGTITAGSVVRTTGYNGTRVLVELADADAAGETPGLGIARDDITDAIAGNVVVFGKLSGINTSGFSVADTLYLSTTPGVLTNTRPTGATTGIQAIARVLDVDASNGIVEVVGAGRTNDLPNLAVDGFWYGDSNGQPAEGTATAFGRSLLDDADAVGGRATMGVQSVMGFALTDETSALTTGQKIATDMPVSMNVKRVYASVGTAGGTSAITIDVENEGVSILNAVVSISAGSNNAETTTFAAAASNYQLTKGDALTIDVDAIDDGTARSLKVYLIGDITA